MNTPIKKDLTTIPIVVYFGHFEDHAETDSGWELRKHEPIDKAGVETTPTSKFRPSIGMHASESESSDPEQECMSPSRRRSLFPEATNDELEALLDELSRDDSLSSGPAKTIRTVSEVIRKLVREVKKFLFFPFNLLAPSTCSSSSTSTEHISMSILSISTSTSKSFSKD